jgi:hypothetical protein
MFLAGVPVNGNQKLRVPPHSEDGMPIITAY